jgi:hypothetical protein
MDVTALLTEIGTRLSTIAGLRVAPVGSDTMPNPPAAVVFLPERIDYDQTYGRGLVKVNDLIVGVAIGKTSRRSAVAALSPFLSDTGAKSIKLKLDSTNAAPYANAFDVQVIYSEIDYSGRMNDVDYLFALFHLNAYGPGST